MPQWYQNIRCSLLLAQSLLGVLVFSRSLRPRHPYVQRFLTTGAIGMLLCYWAQHQFYLRDQTIIGAIMRAGCMFLVYACVIICAYLCYDESIWTVLLVASSGYIAQDMCGSLKTLCKVVPSIAALSEHPYGILLLDLFCYGGGCCLLAVVLRPYLSRREMLDDQFKAVFSVIALFACIGMARITQDNLTRNEIAQFSESLYQILIDVFLLLLQFGVMEQRQMNQSVDAMRELLHEQYVQYQSGKENMEVINEKYHDIKQLLHTVQAPTATAELRQLEQRIDEYDAAVHTGNDVLDVILSDKCSLCNQREIQLTSYVGGVDLGFVDEVDLYSLFNNVLNNAIDAVSALSTDEERFITLTIQGGAGMVTIHAENPFSGELEFKNGLPQTRRNPDYHGFGMRSMERVAAKYGGALSAKAVNNIFYLDIILIAPA